MSKNRSSINERVGGSSHTLGERQSIHSSTPTKKQQATKDWSYLLASPEMVRERYSNHSSGGDREIRNGGKSLYSFSNDNDMSASKYSSSSFATNEVHASLYSPRSETRNPYDVRVGGDDNMNMGAIGRSQFDSIISEGSTHVSAYGTATDIISAFRELQDKLQVVERGRKDAIKVRDDLKANCISDRNDWINSINQKDIQMTSSLLTTKASNDQLRIFKEDLELKMSCKEDINRSLHRNMNANKTIAAGLEDDISKLKGTLVYMEDRNFKLNEQLTNSKVKVNRFKIELEELPNLFSNQYKTLIKKINQMEDDINDVRTREKRKIAKTKALIKYVDLVYQMNNDLISTLIAREESKERIIQLAGKFTPPRYAWPKTMSNPNIQRVFDVVQDAAVASALEQSAEKAVHLVNSHIKEINRAFPHSPNPKVSPYKLTSSRSNSNSNTPIRGGVGGSPLRNNTDRFSLKDLGDSPTRRHHIINRLSSRSSNNSDSSSLDSIIDNLSDSDGSDVSLSELKEIYIAKEKSKSFNDYIKARIMKKRASKNKILKSAKRTIKSKTKRRNSIKSSVEKKSQNNLAANLVDPEFIMTQNYGHPLSTSRSAPNRLSRSVNGIASLASIHRPLSGSSGLSKSYSSVSTSAANRYNISPGKLLERHAAETLAAATTAYAMKLRDTKSARVKADVVDSNRNYSMGASMSNGGGDYVVYNPVYSSRADKISSSSRSNGAFIPSSGQPTNKEHNLKAKQQSTDRARVFRNQARISHDQKSRDTFLF